MQTQTAEVTAAKVSYASVSTNSTSPPQIQDTAQKRKGTAALISFIFIIFTALIVWNSILTSKLNTQTSSKDNSALMANSTLTNSSNSANNTNSTLPVPFCQQADYFKSVLKEEYSQNIGGLIKNGDNEKKYEASSVAYDRSRDVYWVVFDNIHSISKLTSDLSRNADNTLLAPSTDIKINKDDDGYEGITRDSETDILYLLTEAVGFEVDGEEIFHPIIRSAVYNEASPSTYAQTQICAVNMSMPTGNKGLEGLDLLSIDDQKYFVALCEGNFCASSDEGRLVGNGRIVLLEFAATDISADARYQYLMDALIYCVYNVINIFELPSYIEFEDYSDFQFKSDNSSGADNVYDVAIVSQATSAFYIGEVVWSLDGGPVFDAEYEEEIYPFPYGGDCEVVFCNVEGVAFVNEFEFVMVSDSAKRGDDHQPWLCGQKDQSVHVFKLP